MGNTENVTDILRAITFLESEKKSGVPIPYSSLDDVPFFHRDAMVQLILLDMLRGESVFLPRGVGYSDLQRLIPPMFPLIFTYHEDREGNRMQVWRIR